LPSSVLADHTEESAFAKELGMAPATLRKRRNKALRTGKPLVPPFVVIARKIFYPNTAKAEWLKSIQQIPGRRRA
jgi:hypothetical protein